MATEDGAAAEAVAAGEAAAAEAVAAEEAAAAEAVAASPAHSSAADEVRAFAAAEGLVLVPASASRSFSLVISTHVRSMQLFHRLPVPPNCGMSRQ